MTTSRHAANRPGTDSRNSGNGRARETYIAWLRDAHAMEKGLETALDRQAEHARSDPAMSERLRLHCDETRRHAELVEQALKRNDGGHSGLKDTMGKVQAGVQGMMSAAASDTMIKDTLTGIAAEHFEIACYESLRTAAEELGDTETVGVCERILEDERAMASFLEKNLPRVTITELSSAAAR